MKKICIIYTGGTIGMVPTEAAIAKLYYLFSLGLDRDTIKQKMTENLRGEITIN